MPNATGRLNGDTIASQSSLIVKYPGSTSLYYVFTVGSLEINNANLSYSIVDMTLGGGLGDIVPAQKNIPLANAVSEKVTAIKHPNTNDVWIVSHIFGSNEFLVYYMNCKGLSTTPAQYAVGQVVDGDIGNALGYLKGSPDGSKIAIANLMGVVEIFDFNNETGEITNSRSLDPNPGTVCRSYGLEFSPDSKLLYVSSIYNCGAPGDYDISQYDLTATDIIASKTMLVMGNGLPVGAMQLGPDDKIYVAFGYRNSLGVINDPNVKGAGCNLVQQQMPLPASSLSGIGLPNAVSGYLRTLLGKDTAFCDEFSYVVRPEVANAAYVWSDGSRENEITITSHGTYYLEIETAEGCRYSDTLTITNQGEALFDIGSDTALCAASFPYTLSVDLPEAQYVWQDMSTAPVYPVIRPGTYYVRVNNEGCIASDTITISAKTSPAPQLGPDREICPGQEIVLDPGIDGLTYVWQDGTTSPVFTVNAPGFYSVSITNECGTSSDQVMFTEGTCHMLLPNAFTPDKATNNIFRLTNPYGLKDFMMQVYNRWGQLVYRSADPSQGWNGVSNGKVQPAGSYVYVVSYTDPVNARKQVQKGSLILIR